MSRSRYFKRTFLAHPASNTSSYIIAEVESTDDGKYPLGNNVLTIADCNKQIELHFSLGNARARRRSLAQAKLLADFVNEFLDNLREEAKLIERDSRKHRRLH